MSNLFIDDSISYVAFTPWREMGSQNLPFGISL